MYIKVVASQMKSFKEVNKAIESILDIPQLYDVRYKLTIIKGDLSRDDAEAYLNYNTDQSDDSDNYTITTSKPENYCEDLNLAISTAKRIAEKDNDTFVLSLEDGEWKAAYGDWGNCAEYKGANPAYVTCVALLKFMGKL